MKLAYLSMSLLFATLMVCNSYDSELVKERPQCRMQRTKYTMTKEK